MPLMTVELNKVYEWAICVFFVQFVLKNCIIRFGDYKFFYLSLWYLKILTVNL